VAIDSVQVLVENRLIATKEVLKKRGASLIGNTISEIKAVHGYEDKDDTELLDLEKSYIADLVAIEVIKYSMDIYKEEAKADLGPGGIEHEAQDKLKYLKEQIKTLKESAEFKAGRLGLNLKTVPPLAAKITAAVETDN
jgi:hypothetical protein